MVTKPRVVGVSMVKDESDVIEFTLTNLLENQGVDHIIVANNLSSDNTQQILDSFPDVTTVLDEEVAYNQSLKMTRLAKLAFNDFGADIVIPFDADEFWTGVHIPLVEVLAQAPYDIINVRLFNYFSSSQDDNAKNPFERIVHRDQSHAPLNKVAIRRMDDFTIHQGNHSASGSDSIGVAFNCMIGHFPWRSFPQFLKKVKNGYAAYEASDLPEEMGSHWRSYGRLLYQDGEKALLDLYKTWFVDPETPTVKDPILNYVPK